MFQIALEKSLNDEGVVGSTSNILQFIERKVEEAAKEGSEWVLNLLVVLSDRTRNSWQGAGAGQLKLPEGTEGYWLDVGGEAVPHVAITQLVLDPPAAAPGSPPPMSAAPTHRR